MRNKPGGGEGRLDKNLLMGYFLWATIKFWGGILMKARIDKEACTACELCVDTCPDIFEMGEDTAVVKVSVIPGNLQDCAKEAASSCPTEAIIIEE
jgi:ferredoxin